MIKDKTKLYESMESTLDKFNQQYIDVFMLKPFNNISEYKEAQMSSIEKSRYKIVYYHRDGTKVDYTNAREVMYHMSEVYDFLLCDSEFWARENAEELVDVFEAFEQVHHSIINAYMNTMYGYSADSDDPYKDSYCHSYFGWIINKDK